MSYVVERVAAIDAAWLDARISGSVLLSGSDGYAEECSTYNLNQSLRPAVVVSVHNAEDVQVAVGFAAARSLPIAVRATGHQVVLPAEGAVLINTSRMVGITVDETEKTVRVEAGVRWEQVIEQVAGKGLAAINGSAPTVGVIGYVLGGGHSPLLGRKLGYAADHVRSIDVVTPDGELRHVTRDADGDLFWALRGGKGNFGVVTAIELELVELTHYYGGGLYFPGERLADLLQVWRTWAPELPDEATTSIAAQRLPDLPQLPDPLRGSFVVHFRFAYLGGADEAERLLAPIRQVGEVLVDTIQVTPYAEVGSIHLDPPLPMPYYDRTTSLTELGADAAATLVELAGPGSGCPLVSLEVRALGGALDRQPAVENAVSSRGIPFVVFGFGVGGPEDADHLSGYLEQVMQALEPWSVSRRMMNFLSPDEAGTAEEVEAAYGTERYARLAAVKAKYDPANLLRFNHNILPAHQPGTV